MMNILFYTTQIEAGFAHIDEEEMKHLTAVLRRKVGDPVELTDGKGRYFAATIAEINKRNALARINNEIISPPTTPRLHLAVAPTKNIERFEWLIEKAVEIGVDAITPLLCRHSERTTVRQDRLEKIVISAMKQCLRTWLPTLHPMTSFKNVVSAADNGQRFIGWCPPDLEMPHLKNVLAAGTDTTIFIGPEGDFSPEEIEQAKANKCVPITLGKARLRTETAGIYACSVFNLAQE